MDIQSALGECDIARAILIAMGSYKKTPSPNESIIQSLTFAVESSLDRAKNVFSHKKNSTIQTQPTLTSEPAIARTLTWPTEVGTTNQLTIGTRIRQLRKERMLTQADIAEAVNVSTQAVHLWENNTTEPPSGMVIPLANALKCDPMWLLSGNPLDVKPAQPAPVNVMKGADLANIGVRIESRRNEMGMSPLKLAEEIDTSGAMILEWEEGKAIPHSSYYDKLAKALNTTVTWLITGNHITDKTRES
ncbi:helix-turn-helix domain-containing protein [Salmonella enterica subsp. enterica serovar Hvittingfoss]|nr:helix-turn-helix domain-containing protein [Salmonella enterica subsp. enterica serovar Hvittingfoss]EHL2852756.1 helix-turn-helix domain-containing protein [Salmonella enterica subsp. enterica serovar Hvittingfoss]